MINKFRAKKNKAAFAQGLIRKLDKLDRIEIDDKEDAVIKFRFPDAPRSGKVVVNVQQVTKAYGDHLVLKDINFNWNGAKRWLL